MREALVSKLHPRVFRTGGRLTAVLAWLLGEVWTQPHLLEVAVTVEGQLVWLTDEGDEFGGGYDDLVRNLNGAATAAGLTAAERRWLLTRLDQQLSDHRRGARRRRNLNGCGCRA